MAFSNCKICGRKLKNPLYQKIGFGKICYEKFNKKQVKITRLFDPRKKG